MVSEPTEVKRLIRQLRGRSAGDTPRTYTAHMANDDLKAATALSAQEEQIDRLTKLVKDAFNEGFREGMREYTTSRGGNDWQLSKARAALEGSRRDG